MLERSRSQEIKQKIKVILLELALHREYKQGYRTNGEEKPCPPWVTDRLRLISLWDMFVRHAYKYALIDRLLGQLEIVAKPGQHDYSIENFPDSVRLNEATASEKNAIVYCEKLKSLVLRCIDDIGQESKALCLKRTNDRLKWIRQYVESARGIELSIEDALMRDLGTLRQALQDDLTEYKAFIPSLEQAKYYDQPKLFGDKVYKHFKSARQDILEAGNCYATDSFTACVFHVMRVAEHGMRILARDLKIRAVGKKKQIPLDYAEWGEICGALKKKVEQLQQKTRGPTKSAILKRYGDAASQVDFINEIWRKNVSHARQPYNAPEALSALTRVREFMQSLAEWLCEK